jgi:hypothetical protein
LTLGFRQCAGAGFADFGDDTLRVKAALMSGMLLAAVQANAAEPTLTITSGGKTATYTTSQLSGRPDAAADDSCWGAGLKHPSRNTY